MAITPDYSHSIVSFPLHVSRVNIFWHFVDLQDLSAIDLVNAGSASTFDSKFVGIDCFTDLGFLSTCRILALVQVFLDQDLALYWIILGL